MTHLELRNKFFGFWESKSHVLIPGASLVPESDPTTLFTGSGMQPLIPYLLGEMHPLGKRLMNIQKCLRTVDIDEVGDNRHHTFFEMLGNWSLGDYFKDEQLRWYWEFLTKGLGFKSDDLHVTCFEGSIDAPKDEESEKIWKKIGVSKDHIHFYGVKKNWWSRSGTPEEMPAGEIGGPDSEVFYDFGEERHIHERSNFKDQECHVNCDCGRYLEIGNSVFIQYQKQSDGTFKELAQKNVDFGGGLERTLAAINDDPDDFASELFENIIHEIEEYTDKKYSDPSNKPSMRIIADHIQSASFLIKDGVLPSNKDRGYILRRILRRAAVKIFTLGGGLTALPAFGSISESVLRTYDRVYFERNKDREIIPKIIEEEINKFAGTLDRGLKEFEKTNYDERGAGFAFNLYQTYGFPPDVTQELLIQKGEKPFDQVEFNKFLTAHQELSRKVSSGMFKGGLADHSEVVTKYHTATHLLQAALRQVLGDHVHQEGSNLTAERLRFDFSHGQKLTPEELAVVEKLVNGQIKKDLKRNVTTMNYEEAIRSGAMAFFKERYPEKVTVFSFGDFSKEICGGPHVENTGILGTFKIVKEEGVAGGIRRIYAILEP